MCAKGGCLVQATGFPSSVLERFFFFFSSQMWCPDDRTMHSKRRLPPLGTRLDNIECAGHRL